MTPLRRATLKVARSIFREHNDRTWSVRGRQEFARRLKRRTEAEKDASILWSKLRSIVRDGEQFAKSHAYDATRGSNPADELAGWIHRFPDAVAALRAEAKGRQQAGERVVVEEIFQLDASLLKLPPVPDKAVHRAVKGKPFTVATAFPVGTTDIRVRAARELAAIGILCGIWPKEYDALKTPQQVLREEARKYSSTARSRKHRGTGRT